ncbi:MAG TPA: hypothetical protein OIM63_00170 [Bacilli bacterium]|jgi:hypothetical protein|nr:hypothetical protein [Bacilli bacterium]
MNKEVILLAIDDVLKIIYEIEDKNKIEEIDNNKLEKEINSLLVNLSSYKIRNIKYSNEFLSAFQYAFNLVKHEKSIVTIKQVRKRGITLPMKMPFCIGTFTRVYWLDLSNKPLKNKKYINQYNNYLTYLNNKDIKETLNELKKMLLK